jgi:RimJ/RimL family protein N-acetyltransferase
MVWAVYDGKIIGQCDFRCGGTRDWHTCTIGLMIDRDFRGEGIGRFLFENILKKAREMKIQIAKLYIFDDNKIAKKLYQKLGFQEFARLPKGFYRQDKFSDALQMYKVLND